MGDAETSPNIIGQEAVYILESLLQANTLKHFHIFNIFFFKVLGNELQDVTHTKTNLLCYGTLILRLQLNFEVQCSKNIFFPTDSCKDSSHMHFY